MVIGKKGEDIENLKAELARRLGVPVAVNIEEVRKPEIDAQLISESITQQLEKRIMYEFLDRFVTIALPRVRDFRGISGRSFDGRGNYNVGVKEQIIFPEIEYDKIDAIRGLNISITTSAKNDDECRALLGAFRFPFKN